MKNKLVFIALLTCTMVIGQIRKPKTNIKRKDVTIKKIVRPLATVKFPMYKTMIYPNNEEIIYTNSPTFKYSLNNKNTTSQSPQRKTSKIVILTVVKLSDDPNWLAENNIILQEKILSNINTGTIKSFNNLSLTLNNAYAWNIEFKGKTPNEDDMNWNVFYYFDKNTIIDKEDPHKCASKYILNPSFKEKSYWKVTNNNSLITNSGVNTVFFGHDDNGAGSITSPNTILHQKLRIPIQMGKSYQLKFSLKQQKESKFSIKVIAFNGILNSLAPSSDIAIMTISGTIPYKNDWSKITLSAWEAHKNFNNIALVFIPENKKNILHLLLDRVCLYEVESACELNSLTYEGENTEGDESITVTYQEYLAGSVHDLYPNQNTTTVDWYANIADECLAIGGDDSDEDDIKLNELDEIEIDKTQKELKEIEEQLISNEPDYFKSKNGIQPIHQNIKYKCKNSKPKLDSSKPFGGRDIVYIHGLQLEAIIANIKNSSDFQGKWPVDKHAFYKNGGHNPSNTSQDGEFYNEARLMWDKHIIRGLGSLSLPSNSYLIATYSANQRLEVAIHAVLSQINEAMAGNNPNLIKSLSAKKSRDCFGSNGIVLIAHSTGGLVASTLLGIAEKSNTNQTYKDYYGDVRFISNKLDAQIGIDAAYGGSPLATAGIAVLSGVNNSPLINKMAKIFLKNDNLQHLTNFDPYQTILYDLMPTTSRNKWRPIMQSNTPTLKMTGITTGKSAEGLMTMAGNLLMRGFDDGVLSSSSQSGHYKKRPGFKVKNRGKLVDKGTELRKRRALVRMSKSGKNIHLGERNYYITPYLSGTGMLQGNSVKSVIDNPNQFIPNHFTVLQTTGDHFDNVTEVQRNQNNYAYTDGDNLLEVAHLLSHNIASIFIPPVTKIRNNEETSVVFNSHLYSSGLLNINFAKLNQEWIKKETWGFHAPKIIMVRKCIRLFKKERCIKLPKVTWHYYEYIKWQRKYHLLKDYKTKRGMDYMYEYILR